MVPFVSHHWSHATLQKNIVLVRKITQCNWFEPRKIMGLRSMNIQFSKWIIFYKPTKDSNKKLGRRYSVHEQTYRWRRRIKTMEMCPQGRTGVGTNRDRWIWLVRKTHGIMKIQCTRTDLLMEKKGSNNGNVPAGKYNSSDQKNVD